MNDVQFFFDPGCPWTWKTSRWLVQVAEARGTDVSWRSFSLALLNAGREVPEQYKAVMASGQAALRVVEALRAAKRNDDIGAFYTAFGRRRHEQGEEASVDLVRQAAADAGVGDVADAIDDERWDEPIAASLAEAQALVGPDVGSPVLALTDGGTTRGLFGPIVSEATGTDDALRIWDAVTTLTAIPSFAEVKRARS